MEPKKKQQEKEQSLALFSTSQSIEVRAELLAREAEQHEEKESKKRMYREVSFPKSWLKNISQDSESLTPEEWFDFAQEALDNLDYVEKKLLKLEHSPSEIKLIRQIHGAIVRVHEIGLLLRLRPGIEMLQRVRALLEYTRDGDLYLSQGDVTNLFQTVELLEQLFQVRQSEQKTTPMKLHTNQLAKYRQTLSWIYNQLEQIESYQRSKMEQVQPSLGDLLVAKGAITRTQLNHVIAKKSSEKSLEQALIEQGQVSPQEVQEVLDFQKRFSRNLQSAVSVGPQDMLELRNVSGDLKATVHALRGYLSQIEPPNAQLEHLQEHLDSLSASLHQRIHSFSAQSIEAITQRMERMVQEFSRRFGRDVEFTLDANVLRVERNQAELLGDLLIHLLRNAIEHGIEDLDDRVIAGKGPQGQIHVNIYHEDGNLMVSVEDDGCGMDLEKLRAEAIRQGHMEEGDELHERLLNRLLFEEGLAVHMQSSRPGYGLDKISRRLKDLKGEVRYQERKEGGSFFLMQIPLPPSHLHGLILSHKGQMFLLPSSAVRDIVPYSELLQRTQIGEREHLLWEDAYLPVKSLDIQTQGKNIPNPMHERGEESFPLAGHAFYIVVETGSSRCVLHVERLHEVGMVELSFVGPSFLRNPLIGGGGFLREEQLVWIIDPAQICVEIPLS